MFKFTTTNGLTDFFHIGNSTPEVRKCKSTQDLALWFKQFANACRYVRLS